MSEVSWTYIGEVLRRIGGEQALLDAERTLSDSSMSLGDRLQVAKRLRLIRERIWGREEEVPKS